jgi:hypothetical protein
VFCVANLLRVQCYAFAAQKALPFTFNLDKLKEYQVRFRNAAKDLHPSDLLVQSYYECTRSGLVNQYKGNINRN